MKRTIRPDVKATAMLLLASSATLVLAVTGAQAGRTQALRSQPAAAASTCKIVIAGAPWRIRAHVAGGSLAGNTYTIAGKGTSCAAARTWVKRFTHQQGTAPIKGPAGFTCRSLSTATSGDQLLYSGACMHPPHNLPFFEWAPKTPRG
jgi:hypothetical protein